MLFLVLVPNLVAADIASDELLARLASAHDEVPTRIPGCFRMEGTYTSDFSLGLLGGQREAALVRGTLRDGAWEGRELAMADHPDQWFPAGHLARSAFGTDPAATKGEGWGGYLLGALPGMVSAQFVERRGDQWALVGTLDGGPRSDNTMVTLFDDEPLRVRALQARVTSPILGLKAGGHKIRILRLTMDLVFGPDGAPVSESVDARFGQGVVTGTTKVSATWRSSPCGS
jgi:hypothetical protein